MSETAKAVASIVPSELIVIVGMAGSYEANTAVIGH